MLKTLKVLVSLLFFFISNIAFSQNIEGLKEIVKAQQDKISIIEDNLKKLIGSIEEQSNLNKSESSLKLIQSQVNEINQKLILLENNIKNVTNLSYNL
jgi:thiamine kinase-like enzyme